MTRPRQSSGDGQGADSHVAGVQKSPEESPIGAFDLLSAQIDSLRQEIDYLKEQVALLQEKLNGEKAREG